MKFFIFFIFVLYSQYCYSSPSTITVNGGASTSTITVNGVTIRSINNISDNSSTVNKTIIISCKNNICHCNVNEKKYGNISNSIVFIKK